MLAHSWPAHNSLTTNIQITKVAGCIHCHPASRLNAFQLASWSAFTLLACVKVLASEIPLSVVNPVNVASCAAAGSVAGDHNRTLPWLMTDRPFMLWLKAPRSCRGFR